MPPVKVAGIELVAWLLVTWLLGEELVWTVVGMIEEGLGIRLLGVGEEDFFEEKGMMIIKISNTIRAPEMAR